MHGGLDPERDLAFLDTFRGRTYNARRPGPGLREGLMEVVRHAHSGTYEGKAKIVRPIDERTVSIFYKDHATAFDGTKFSVLEGKGPLNARISALVFCYLEERGVRTHFLGVEDPRTHRARRVSIVALEVVVRNLAAGSLVKRLGIEEGRVIEPPLVELFYKDDRLHDPLVNDDHVRLLRLASPALVRRIKAQALVINGHLRGLFAAIGLRLVDFKLEFGTAGGKLYLADEISPDTCRLWDAKTGNKLDKDRFRFDLGDVLAGYREIERRLEAHLGSGSEAGTRPR